MTDTVTVTLPAVQVVAAPPLRVSQRTSEAVMGVHRRAYLDSLAEYAASGGEVLRLGHLRLVAPAEYLAWLGSRGAIAPAERPTDDLAAELGLRAV